MKISTHKSTYNECAIPLFMHLCNMLNQQKQEIARSVPDPSLHRGWGLEIRLHMVQYGIRLKTEHVHCLHCMVRNENSNLFVRTFLS